MELKTGITGEFSLLVEHKHTAASFGSGFLEVFATPMMIAAMEQACLESVQPYLEEGQTTVGTRVEITHDAPTPVGHTVNVKTEVTDIDRRKLTFRVEAFDGDIMIGSGTHERFIIDKEKFLAKVGA